MSDQKPRDMNMAIGKVIGGAEILNRCTKKLDVVKGQRDFNFAMEKIEYSKKMYNNCSNNLKNLNLNYINKV